MDRQHKESKHFHIWRRMANSQNWLSSKRTRRNQNTKSDQNKAPCANSASQSNEIIFHESTQITPEQRNESTVSNSRSAIPPTTQLEESAASDDENEMETITASTKWGHHDSSEEEPNSPATKTPASGSPASGRNSTPVLTGTGMGDPPKVSTFCPDPKRPGKQGSSGGDRSPIWPPDNEQPKAQPKPSKQNKSSQELLKKIHTYKSWMTTTLSSGTVENDQEFFISLFSTRIF